MTKMGVCRDSPNSSEAAISRHVKLKNLMGKEFQKNLLPMRSLASL